MKDFRRLKVWELAHALTMLVYELTREFPKSESYGLTPQLRRAASSVPANIAEGCGRDGDKEFARYVQIAMGSASELEYHLLLSRDLGHVQATQYEAAQDPVVVVKRMLGALLSKLRSG